MITQGTPEWFALRLGKATASRMNDVTAKTKGGYSTSRANYMAQLIVERLTGLSQDSYTNAAMQWGTETEPLARAAYAFHTNTDVVECDFFPHPFISMSGASPDGLVGRDGLLEIKCPIPATHLETLLGRAVPSKYLLQMQWQMACTERAWCDFISYDPRMPEGMQLFCERVPRNAAQIEELEREVLDFLNELDHKLAELQQLYGRST